MINTTLRIAECVECSGTINAFIYDDKTVLKCKECGKDQEINT